LGTVAQECAFTAGTLGVGQVIAKSIQGAAWAHKVATGAKLTKYANFVGNAIASSVVSGARGDYKAGLRGLLGSGVGNAATAIIAAVEVTSSAITTAAVQKERGYYQELMTKVKQHDFSKDVGWGGWAFNLHHQLKSYALRDAGLQATREAKEWDLREQQALLAAAKDLLCSAQ